MPEPWAERVKARPGGGAEPQRVRAGAARTARRTRRRSAGCSGRSAATAAAARARAGRPTRGRRAASRPAPAGSSPAWKSNAAPTPTSSGADSRGRISCIHCSCLGWPVPTHTTAAPEASMARDLAPAPPPRERPERRRVGAGDVQPGEALAQPPLEHSRAPRRASAVQVDRDAAAARRVRRTPPSGRGRRCASLRVAERVQRPHERLPVGHGQRRAEHGGGVSGCSGRSSRG